MQRDSKTDYWWSIVIVIIIFILEKLWVSYPQKYPGNTKYKSMFVSHTQTFVTSLLDRTDFYAILEYFLSVPLSLLAIDLWVSPIDYHWRRE